MVLRILVHLAKTPVHLTTIRFGWTNADVVPKTNK